MPSFGERKTRPSAKGYRHDPLRPLAQQYSTLAKELLSEGIDLFGDKNPLRYPSARETLKEFFINESVDENAFESIDEYNDEVQMMEDLFENDIEGINEYASLASYNPVIGITFPMHKNILMNCIFDKGAIPKAVARSPKFTITMETRKLIGPDGKEYDMFTDQMEMTRVMDSTVPFVTTKVTLPEIGATDILQTVGGVKGLDNLSLETYVSAVYVQANVTEGQLLPDGTKAGSTGEATVKIPANLHFRPGYGDFERAFMEPVNLNFPNIVAAGVADPSTDVLSGSMNKNSFNIMSAKGVIKAVDITARKDTSNAMVDTCQVRWDAKTDLVEIPSAIPLNTPISPEEVKDIGALYNMDQLTKIMSMMNLVLENYKDDKIRQELDMSYKNMDPRAKTWGVFDFAPSEGYALDFVEYRHAVFMDLLDTTVTNMLQVLNDPNMTVTVLGRPDIIRKITPTTYSYQSPSAIGPVELNFNKTVTTSDKRVYNFISSQKLKGTDELMIILCPRNTERIVYRIYDYQMYVSNEIRNVKNYTLPAIHAFQRWKFVAYQPVQGRVLVLNPSGVRGVNQPIMSLPEDASLFAQANQNPLNYGDDHSTNAYLYNQSGVTNGQPQYGTVNMDAGLVSRPINSVGQSTNGTIQQPFNGQSGASVNTSKPATSGAATGIKPVSAAPSNAGSTTTPVQPKK